MNKNCSCPYCKKPNWISKEDYIIEMSKFLGYPKCCTKEYLKNISQEKTHFGVTRHLAASKISQDCDFATGFMPCKRHAERILNEGKSFRRIFRNRICSTPFPHASKSELKKYLKKIRKNYETV
jgi:hypothetical protein